MASPTPTSEGTIPFDIPRVDKPVSTWYKTLGDITTSSPLIVLHGGPGAGHNYLLSISDIYTKYHIPVIFYDQVGCGKSTHFQEKMGDEAFWTVDLFIRELDNLVDHLNLRSRGFYVLGSSWGGLLTGAYAIRQPRGLLKAVIASGPSSIPMYIEGANYLLSQLPEDVQKTLKECDEKGDYESEEYEKASMVFNKKHVCQLDPFPEPLLASFAYLKEDPTAYMTMQGPSEFRVIGSLKNWEGWPEAHKINVETLLINGRFDEVRDACIEPWFKGIPKVKWITLENSSHMGHWEERERYMEIVANFLS